MKWFVVVVIVAAISLEVNGLNREPNVKFKFKRLTVGPIVEYEAQTIRETYSNLQISEFYSVKLKTMTYLKNQRLKFLWVLEIKYNKRCECEREVKLPFYTVSNITEEMENNYQTQEEDKYEILAFLTFNHSMKFLMEAYGCMNSDPKDKIHKNEFTLILYKTNEPLNLKIWNNQFVVYSYILGYLRIINTAIENNTDENNEKVFSDIVNYCQENTDNINHVSKFDDLYSDSTIEAPKMVKFPFIVPVVIVLTILVLTAIISTFCNDVM